MLTPQCDEQGIRYEASQGQEIDEEDWEDVQEEMEDFWMQEPRVFTRLADKVQASASVDCSATQARLAFMLQAAAAIDDFGSPDQSHDQAGSKPYQAVVSRSLQLANTANPCFSLQASIFQLTFYLSFRRSSGSGCLHCKQAT